jgi:hypothetical protein
MRWERKGKEIGKKRTKEKRSGLTITLNQPVPNPITTKLKAKTPMEEWERLMMPGREETIIRTREEEGVGDGFVPAPVSAM